MGGSRFSDCSILEALNMIEEISGRRAKYVYEEQNRIGDHIWYISSESKFKKDSPA